jgi:PAS domain S-box-containing protein
VTRAQQPDGESVAFHDGAVGSGRPTALFSCSLSGTVLAAGAALGSLPGGPAHALLHPSSHARLDEALQAARDGAARGTVTLRLASRSGVALPVSWSVLAGAGPDATQVVFVGPDPSAGRAFRPSLRVQEAIDHLSREVAVVADADGHVLYASPSVAAVFGYDADGALPPDVWSVVHPDDAPSARQGLQTVVDGGDPRTATLRVRAAGGDWRWVELVAVSLLDDAISGVVCALHDITAEVEAKQARRASDASFRALADTSEEGVCVVGPDGETRYANPRMAAILGMPLSPIYAVELMSTLEGAGGRLETAYAHPDGRERRLRVAATPLHAEDGTPEGTVVMVSDVTDVRRAEQDLRAAAVQDSLTSSRTARRWSTG